MIVKKRGFSSIVKNKVVGLGLALGALLLGMTSCEQNAKLEQEIAAIPVAMTIDRFDQKFHQSTPDQIPELKEKYPYLFPQQFSDSVWIKRQKDSLQLLLQKAVDVEYPSLETLESELTRLFQHIKYYFPESSVPYAIGLINNVDYQSKTILTDSLLLISLDTYLGNDHELYEGIPKYIRQQMDQAYLGSHVAEKFVESKLPQTNDRSFLAQLIYHGKIAYVKSLLLPQVTAAHRFGYTEEQWQWTLDNQKYIWQYFIEKKLLYSTDPSLVQRFIAPAPFSKFYLEIDNETPGQIGIWLGAAIVEAFRERHPNMPLQQLLAMPAQTLFQKSNYKPKR